MRSTYNYHTPAWTAAIILSHLTSPLTIAWFLLTRNDLYIQAGTFTYSVTARHDMGGGARFGTLFTPESRRSKARVIMFQVVGGKVRLYRRVYLKFFSRCPDQGLPSPLMSTAGAVMHSVGPVEISISRCDPKQAPHPLRPRQLPEVITPAIIPVFGPVGSPLGLKYVGYASGTHGVGSLSLHFANQPHSNEDPVRTAEYLNEMRREHFVTFAGKQGWPEQTVRSFNKELKRIGINSTYEELFSNPQISCANKYPPVPSVALELNSSIDQQNETSSPDIPDELRQWRAENVFSHDSVGPKLFAALPEAVHEQLPEYECKLLCHEVYNILYKYGPDLVDQMVATEARAIKRRFMVDGTTFDALMLYWPASKPLCTFQLTQITSEARPSLLSGTAFGITLDELSTLLERLVVINERTDVLAHFEAEREEHERWTRARP